MSAAEVKGIAYHFDFFFICFEVANVSVSISSLELANLHLFFLFLQDRDARATPQRESDVENVMLIYLEKAVPKRKNVDLVCT